MNKILSPDLVYLFFMTAVYLLFLNRRHFEQNINIIVKNYIKNNYTKSGFNILFIIKVITFFRKTQKERQNNNETSDICLYGHIFSQNDESNRLEKYQSLFSVRPVYRSEFIHYL